MKDSIIIYSGGMDSTVLLYEQRERIALAVHFNYGSKHGYQERKAMYLNCIALGIDNIVIDLEQAMSKMNSALLRNNPAQIPDGHYTDESMKATVVPFRNGIMLSIAIGLADSMNLSRVLIAAHTGDHHIYPDCRKPFIHAMSYAAAEGTVNDIEVIAPYYDKTKRDIALIGRDLDVPFHQTWSCYKGEGFHCGVCGTCVERKEALADFDPTTYFE